MSEGFDKLTDTVKGPLNICESALQPLATETGELLALIPRAIKALLAPLSIWIAKKEYNVAEVEKLLEKKLNNVSPDKITEPESYVAVPAIICLYYCIDNKELRNLYANLLAKAMCSDTKDFVHPSFVEIIKQLSPLDAIAINSLGYLCEPQPLIRIFSCEETPVPNERMMSVGMTDFGDAKNKSPLFSHYSFPIPEIESDEKQRALVIQNLNRLGLINIDYREHIIKPEKYIPLHDHLLESSLYEKFKSETSQKSLHLQLTDGYTSPTDFGRLFFTVCCSDI